MMRCIDLNCDLGEGGRHDAELMPLITSANIACGAHAGDEATMHTTIALAQKHGVAIGAHPGFADREYFGRRELAISPADAAQLVLQQVQTIQQIAQSRNAVVRHVKLHGALYNLASRDAALAGAIVDAVRRIEGKPTLFVLSGSVLERVARQIPALEVAAEVFADRAYERDGSLTPRSRPDALVRDEHAAVAQVLRMLRVGVVRATDGADVPITADTVCLHGDGPDPVAFARKLRAELTAAGINVTAVSTWGPKSPRSSA